MNIHTGRPRQLGFRRGLDVVLSWDARYHALARRLHTSHNARVQALAKKMGRLRASGADPLKVARLSAEMDRLGRFHRVRLGKPDTLKPVIDRQVAKDFDISERMVRKVRDDPRMAPFRSTPPWEVPEWEKAVWRGVVARRQALLAQLLARQLMTPERLAKGEPVRIFNGGLQVPFRVGLEWDIIEGFAPPGARGGTIPADPRTPVDPEVRARAIRAFKAKIAAWKRKPRNGYL